MAGLLTVPPVDVHREALSALVAASIIVAPLTPTDEQQWKTRKQHARTEHVQRMPSAMGRFQDDAGQRYRRQQINELAHDHHPELLALSNRYNGRITGPPQPS